MEGQSGRHRYVDLLRTEARLDRHGSHPSGFSPSGLCAHPGHSSDGAGSESWHPNGETGCNRLRTGSLRKPGIPQGADRTTLATGNSLQFQAVPPALKFVVPSRDTQEWWFGATGQLGQAILSPVGNPMPAATTGVNYWICLAKHGVTEINRDRLYSRSSGAPKSLSRAMRSANAGCRTSSYRGNTRKSSRNRLVLGHLARKRSRNHPRATIRF